MKKLFQRRKKSSSDAGSLASGRSASGYNVSPKKELPKLHKAAFDNDIAKLKTFLKKGDINHLDKENRTALHFACAQGNVESVRVLVAHPHCNLNLCDNDRRSALMKCVQCQFQNCLEILIQKRADVNLSDINGNTALHLAAAIPSVDAACLLLDSNANVNQKNKEGSTPLHIAAATENSEIIVKNLIEDGAHVDAVDSSGKTSLMLAASRGHLEIVKLLLSNKADANLKDTRGWSADDYASMSGHHPISMIIFESSQKQEKRSQSRPPSGEHIYATVNKSASGSPFVKSPALKDDDLSLSDSSHSISASDDESRNSNKEKTSKTPVVNVAAFMKQRQMKKMGESVDEPDAPSVSPASSPQKPKPSETEEPALQPEFRPHSYQSNSRKGGPVSPRKPPLPHSRHPEGISANQASMQEDVKDSDDDSPWDEEEEDLLEDKLESPSNRFLKPDADIMKNLGLSPEDIQNIYSKSSDESSHDETKPAPTPKTRSVGGIQNKKRLDDSDSEEAISSAWDEDASEKSEHKLQTPMNFLASSSLLKFDDEVSDSAPAPPSASNRASDFPSASQTLRNEGVLLDDDDESSFDSTKIGKEIEHAKQSTPRKQVIDKVISISENESSEDITTESESEWEIENRQRRNAAHADVLGRDEVHVLSEEDAVPVKTKMATQKVLAQEAAAAVKTKNQRRQEEERRDEEEHIQLLASQDREKIEAALQNALAASADPTESDVSELDDRFMGNAYTNKMGDSRGLPSSFTGKGLKIKTRNESNTGPHLNGVDPGTWTGTETESEIDEDFIGAIPSSLRSSQLSEALMRSGERGELEREAAREKRRAIDAIEQLEFARRNAEALKEQVHAHKLSEDEILKAKNEMESVIRKLNFEQNRLKEQLASSEVEVMTSKEKMKRIEEHLEIESDTRRKHEVTIRELQNELKISEQQLKKFELDNQELSQKIRQISLQEQVSKEKEKVDRGIEEETKQALQLEALNLLLQEKENELIEMRAERNALDDKCERYKDELNIFHSKGSDDKMTRLRRFNEELNDKVEELSRSLEEKEQTSYHASREFSLQIELMKQANEVLTNQVKKEQSAKDVALQDLEALNSQQQMLKRRIEEVEEKLHKEEKTRAALEGEMKGVREQKEAAERRLHNFELNESSSLQESSNLRASLAHKESLLVQSQKENLEFRDKIKNFESEINEFRRDNAKLHGRIEMLQADVTQQESERIRLRRELEDARNMSNSTLTTQQGKLSEIMSDAQHFLSAHVDQLLTDSASKTNQTERIELEKMNAQLKQQLAHLREEIEKINDEKLKKDEELARAQQDRIETHKHLSFTESSMAQLTESQQNLQQDKLQMALELETSKTRCNSLENRVEETHRQMTSLRDELSAERLTSSSARRDIQTLEMEKTHNKDKIMRLENQVKEIELEKQKLTSELSSYTSREKDAIEDKELMLKSRTQLEELVAKLQEEKVSAEEKTKSEIQRCEILESEASGHRRMWEEEVKARSKLSVELARMDQERRDARNMLNAYKDKLSKASLQGKSYRTKYENQKRQRSKLERQIDEYSSRLAAESRARFDTSESECESRLSRMSDEHESEKSRMETTIHELQSRVRGLEQSLRTAREERNTAAHDRDVRITDTSVADLERERNELREELKRARSKSPDESRVRALASAQVNATLDQVNAWLEEKAVAQDFLERLRFDNEEKRVAEANRRADELQRELDVLRSRMQQPQSNEEKKKLQQVTRENIDLQQKLLRTKQDLEETQMKLDHEKKKYKQLHTSALSGAVSGQMMGGHALSQHPLLSTSLANKSSIDVLTSTPRRETTQPTLAQLRHKLDASIAMRLASSPSAEDLSRSGNQRRKEESTHKEYFIP